MAVDIHIVGMSGSLRKGSYNTYLLNACSNLLPEGVTLEIASVGELPLYNADLDIPAVQERPPAVEAFRNVLSNADAILFVSPEYNYSIPGTIKNAIDWASRGTDSPIINKPASVIGATIGLWGTLRMQLAFHPVFQYLNMRPVYKPEVLVAQAPKKFDENGNLIDETTKDLVRKHLQALTDLVLQLKGSQS